MVKAFVLLLSQKFVEGIIVLFIVLTLVFFITRSIADPVAILAPIDASEEQVDELRQKEGLDEPLFRQYGDFWRSRLTFDFGTSFRSNQPAMSEVLTRLRATMELGLTAFAISIFVGVPAGIIAATSRGSSLDVIVRLLALMGQAIPSFWLGLMLILVFSVRLGWLPTGGRGDLAHLILPAITLSAFTMAATMRITRSAMLDVLSSDYIRTAQAKGLRRFTILRRHALRNALLPVVTILGIQMGQLLAGAVVVETVFGWPGLGRLIITSILAADYPVVEAAVVLTTAWIIVMNLLVDLSYPVIDPRVRFGRMR